MIFCWIYPWLQSRERCVYAFYRFHHTHDTRILYHTSIHKYVCASGKFENFNKIIFYLYQASRMAGWKIAYITASTYNPIDFPFFSHVSFTLFSRDIIGIRFFSGSGNVDIIKGFSHIYYVYYGHICQFIIIIPEWLDTFWITKKKRKERKKKNLVDQ